MRVVLPGDRALYASNDLSRKIGLVLWVTGTLTNLYHHYLLANLRPASAETKPGPKKYMVPQGGECNFPLLLSTITHQIVLKGLFQYVTCPHYFGELLAWYGFAMVSHNICPILASLHFTSYLTGRAIATRRWYLAKMGDDYPKSRGLWLPFLL
jgi:steroid 5-alpha reductase family enzyme